MIDQRSKPKLIIEIEDGLVARVSADGFDASQIVLIKIDRDTEGCDAEDLRDVGGDLVWFSVDDVQKADDDLSRDVGRAYEAWGLEPGE